MTRERSVRHTEAQSTHGGQSVCQHVGVNELAEARLLQRVPTACCCTTFFLDRSSAPTNQLGPQREQHRHSAYRLVTWNIYENGVENVAQQGRYAIACAHLVAFGAGKVKKFF